MTSIAEQLRRQGWPPDMIATAVVNGRPIGEAGAAAKKMRRDGWPGYDSAWEADYAAILAQRKLEGDILDWEYHAFTLRLTEPTIVEGKRKRGITYTPDFCIWEPNGRLAFIEIKGFRRTKDINRYKLAKDKYRRLKFTMLSKRKGVWEIIM